MEKDPEYYENERADLLSLIPIDAYCILDIGCGAGFLGKIIKQRQKALVYGIEIDKEASEKAKENLDFIYNESIEKIINNLPINYFDCLIFADVLEHLKNPELILKKSLSLLNENGLIVISIPNFRHYSVIEKILYGNFEYESSGILDNTHIKFFTKRSFFELLYKLNLNLINIIYAKVPYELDLALMNCFYQEKLAIFDFLMEANDFQYMVSLSKNKTNTSPLIENALYKNNSFKDLTFILQEYLKNQSLSYEIYLINRLELEVIFDKKNIKNNIYLSIIYFTNTNYHKSLFYAEKYLKMSSLNKDIANLFSLILSKLGDEKMSLIFREKANLINERSEYYILFDVFYKNIC